ncbi:unnamed protein product [Ilex paraguariensis]|uniref:Acyltransferase n=1 Tax=Ilex paraguariensis TaxID=185542 RepID=A0ABC8T1T5_9AQUA
MTPAVYDWFGSAWTQHFGTWSLLGSSFAALWVMLWWKHVKPDWMLFLLVQEDGVNLLTVIKGTGKYRRSRRHDFVMNFLPPSMSEFRGALERNGWLRFATSPVMFSTLEDGRLVRGLAGVPDEGPVLLVGYHMLLGCEVVPLVEEFLREKNVLVRGVAHPTLFTQMAETQSQEFSFFDLLKVFGAVPVTASNLFKLFTTKSHVLLYPGGVREAFHQKVCKMSRCFCLSSSLLELKNSTCYFWLPFVLNSEKVIHKLSWRPWLLICQSTSDPKR